MINRLIGYMAQLQNYIHGDIGRMLAVIIVAYLLFSLSRTFLSLSCRDVMTDTGFVIGHRVSVLLAVPVALTFLSLMFVIFGCAAGAGSMIKESREISEHQIHVKSREILRLPTASNGKIEGLHEAYVFMDQIDLDVSDIEELTFLYKR